MAFAPQTLRWLADQWEQAIGSAVCSGIVGDSAHNYGYHRAANEVPASDYSRQLAGDRNGIDPGAASAIDMSHNQSEMRLITGRFYASWKDPHDLRLNHVREVIGTLDGRNVIYMDTQDGHQGTSDSSHLWHCHVGGLRSNLMGQHAVNAVLSIVRGESWAQYAAAHPDDPYVRGAGSSPAPAPRPSAPPFPLRSGNYFGLITGPDWEHGGATAQERGWVKAIQQALIRAGVVGGVSDPNSGWADGKYERETFNAVWEFQKRRGGLAVDGHVGPQTWQALFS